MSKGKWLSEISRADGRVHAVISPNDYGLDVGSVIKQSFYTSDGYVTLDVEIIGIMKDGAKLFGAASEKEYSETQGEISQSFNIEDLFNNYYVDVFGVPAFIYNMDELDGYNIHSIIEQRMMIPFKDGLTDKQIEQARRDMADFGVGEVSFSDIKAGTLSDIRKQLIILVPIIVGLLLLTIISILSLTAVSTHKQLKNYGILYLCGSRWKQCAFINMTEILVDVLLSDCLTYILLQSLYLYGALEKTVVVFTANEFIICAAAGIVILIVSVIMPFAIIGRTQPKDILKSEE